QRSVLEAALKEPEVSGLSVVREHAQPAEWLEKDMVIDYTTTGPEVMRITLKGEKTEELRAVVQAVAKSFVEESARQEQRERNERCEKVTAAAAKAEEELRSKRQALRDLAGTNELDPTIASTQQRTVADQLSVTERELLTSRADLAKLQAE